MAPPSFADPAVFPPFEQLPTADSADASTETRPGERWLIAQVKENMTITKPTLIVSDRSNVDFAVVFEESLDLKPWKKGSLLALPEAARSEKGEGKKDFVRVPAGQGKKASAVPGGWDVLRLWEERKGDDACSGGCGEEGVSRCMGCGAVKYCGKECQVKGWSEGHKRECKGFKAIKEIWGP